MAERTSTLTCPHCGHREAETMPTDACQFFYACKGCGALLWPQPGDCCVFCSFQDVPCSPIQEARQGDECKRIRPKRMAIASGCVHDTHTLPGAGALAYEHRDHLSRPQIRPGVFERSDFCSIALITFLC